MKVLYRCVIMWRNKLLGNVGTHKYLVSKLGSTAFQDHFYVERFVLKPNRNEMRDTVCLNNHMFKERFWKKISLMVFDADIFTAQYCSVKFFLIFCHFYMCSFNNMFKLHFMHCSCSQCESISDIYGKRMFGFETSPHK